MPAYAREEGRCALGSGRGGRGQNWIRANRHANASRVGRSRRGVGGGTHSCIREEEAARVAEADAVGTVVSSAASQGQEYQSSLTSLVKMVKMAHHVHDGIRAAAKAYQKLQKLSKRNEALRRNVTALKDAGVRMCHHAVEKTTINSNVAKRKARLGDMEVKRFREMIVGKLAAAHEVRAGFVWLIV